MAAPKTVQTYTDPNEFPLIVANEINQIIKRPFIRLPVSKDIPRFIRNIQVELQTEDGKTTNLFESDRNDSIPASVGKLVTAVYTVLDGPEVCAHSKLTLTSVDGPKSS